MSCESLSPTDDATLHWRQPSIVSSRWLMAAADDRTLGQLEFTSPWSGSKAAAETANGRWQYEHVGLWKPKVIARVNDINVASLEIANSWLYNRAALVAPDGRVIARWETSSFVTGKVEWQDDAGAPLIEYRRGTDEGGAASWWRTQCRVDFTAAGFAHADRDLLLTIGWYFTVLAGDPGLI